MIYPISIVVDNYNKDNIKVFIDKASLVNSEDGIDAFMQGCYTFLAKKGFYVRRSIASGKNISIRNQVIILKNLKIHSSSEADLTSPEENNVLVEEWKHITGYIKFYI